MALSFKAIRTMKVDASQAERADSERRMNPDVGMCIAHNWQDNYGRMGHPWSNRHTSELCPFDPLHVIDVENAQRPNYSSYLNSYGLSLEEGSTNELSYNAGHDTMFGGTTPDRVAAFERNPNYLLPGYTFDQGTQDEFLANQQRMAFQMQRKMNQTQFTSASP